MEPASSQTDRPPISRRERPAKPALTRQGIVETALAILRREGLSKVTMRRIAAALDTGAASLYVYVRDTEDLHAQILDALLSPVTAASDDAETESGGDWRQRLKRLLVRYREVLFAYPELARMAMSTPASGPNYLSLVDALLGLLQEGGVPDREAAWAVDLLLLYATANAAEHSAWKEDSPRTEANFSALSRAISAAEAGTYPHIARLGDELLSGGPERVPWSLDLLINGVLRTPRPIAQKESLQ